VSVSNGHGLKGLFLFVGADDLALSQDGFCGLCKSVASLMTPKGNRLIELSFMMVFLYQQRTYYPCLELVAL